MRVIYRAANIVGNTEFYPSVPYELAFDDFIEFSVEDKNIKDCDLTAQLFVLDRQSAAFKKYESLLDEAGVRYRKKEEALECSPQYLKFLERISVNGKTDKQKWKDLPKGCIPVGEGYKPAGKVTVLDVHSEPNTYKYRFFRKMAQNHSFWAIILLIAVVLLILFVPEFRNLGALNEPMFK